MKIFHPFQFRQRFQDIGQRILYWSRKRKIFFAVVMAIAFLLFVTTANASMAPGNPLYPVKRIGENIAIVATPNIGHIKLREGRRASFAVRRVREAVVLADRLSTDSDAAKINDAKSIDSLLREFSRTMDGLTISLSQAIDSPKPPPRSVFDRYERETVETYAYLERLRLEAPPENQAGVLQATEIIQENIATIDDTLQQPPVSPGDINELTRYVSMGFLTKQELTSLMTNAHTNRKLLNSLRLMVQEGKMPPGVLYAISFDRFTAVDPKQVDTFRAAVEFDELRKVVLLLKSINPTPSQKKAIDVFMNSYEPGQAIPDPLRPFLGPLVYGLHLVDSRGVNLAALNADQLSPERRIFYDLWKPILNTKDDNPSAPMYRRLLEITDIQFVRNSALLERVQLEVLKALRAEVVYLAMPPGWTARHVDAMKDEFQHTITQLRAAEIAQMKTDVAITALASVTVPLEEKLPSAEIDRVREDMRTAVEQLRSDMVKTALAASLTTQTPPAVDTQALAQRFEETLTTLQANAPNDATVRDQIEALKGAFHEATSRLAESRGPLKEQLEAQAVIAQDLRFSVEALARQQQEIATNLDEKLNGVNNQSQATISTLRNTIDSLKQTQEDRLVGLQTKIEEQAKLHAALEFSLVETVETKNVQITELRAQLNLSEAARAKLKQHVDQEIERLATSQNSAIEQLQTAVANSDTLRAQLGSELFGTISALHETHDQLAAELRAQAANTQTLQSQVEASLADAQAAQVAIQTEVDLLVAEKGNVRQILTDLEQGQADVVAEIQANGAATAALRSDMEQAIGNMQTVQQQTHDDLNATLITWGGQLTQEIGQIKSIQDAAQANAADISGNVEDLTQSVGGIQTAYAALQVDLQGYVEADVVLRAELTQSIQTLQQAQQKTDEDIAALKTSVAALRASVDDIQQTQVNAQAQINSLLSASADWADVAASVRIDIAALQQLQQDLDEDFAQKSAALETQFQQYKLQLNADIQRLHQTTDEEILRLQQQVQLLQQQLQTTTTTLPPPPPPSTSPGQVPTVTPPPNEVTPPLPPPAELPPSPPPPPPIDVGL